MPEIKQQITTGNLIQIGAMSVAVAIAFAVVQSNVATLAKAADDHEYRIRTMEREIAVELTKINTKLGSIEKAVKQ